MPERNDGVIMSGGSISGGAVALGRGASAIQGVGAKPNEVGLKDLEALLQRLKQEIETHKAEVNDPAEATQAVDTVRNEFHQPRPNKLTVRSVVTGLSESLKTVAHLAPMISSVKELVETVMR